MADDQSLRSPDNPHFFQPLLPGFCTHLSIPVVFFSKHLKGRNDHIKTAKLRTDASGRTWLVKINGLRFADGWEGFAVAHDLRIGDIIIFRHEGEMAFHVTAFGPSCCDIQYTSRSSHDICDDSQDQTNNTVTRNSSGEKRKGVEKTPRTTKKKSSSDHSHFMAHVSPWSLRFDRLYVPISFSRSNGMDNMSGKDIVLLDEEGRSWNLNITTYTNTTMQTYVGPGWRRFCAENGMSQGHQYTFKLVRKSAPPVIRLSLGEPAPESALHHSYYVGSVSSNDLRKDRLYLKRQFITANGLDRGFSEIILKNEWGGQWSLGLRYYESPDHTYLGPGWKTFCQVNGIKAGDSNMFKVVETGDKPVLLLCSSNRGKTPSECSKDSDDVDSLSSDTSSGDYSREESQESEEESLGDEGSSQEWFEMEKEKNIYRASSSYSQDPYVKLTLTPRALRTYKLMLPLSFTRVNGINKPGKMILLDKDGVKKQVVDLLDQNRNTGIMRLGKGWREFCDAHGVKVGESFLLKLIREDEEAIPQIFFTKINCSKKQRKIILLDRHGFYGDVDKVSGKASPSRLPYSPRTLLNSFLALQNIPVAFFLKHVQGSNDHIKTAKLRTDASAKTWLVKIDSLKLTDGWEEFAVAHELRVGDITIFRHEGEMVFHVTAFGPSFCDIQYTSASSHNINDDCQGQTNNNGEKRKRVKKNPRTKEEPSSDQSQFVANVSPSSLRFNRLHIPNSFARSNGLNKMSGKGIVLLNEEGRSWNFNLKYNRTGMSTYVRPGWRRFCSENGMKKGHRYTFELVRKSAPPVLRLCRAEHDPKPAPESSVHHSYYVGSVSSNSLINDKLYLKRQFITANGLEKGFSEINVKNEWGGRWSLGLRHYESHNHTYLGPGWKTFCQVNGMKAGDSFMFKLVETGDKPVLLLCNSNRGETPLEIPEDSDHVHSLSSDTSSGDDSREESQESEEESLEDDSRSKECFEMEKRKSSLRCICSSPYSKHRFLRLTLTQNALKTSVLVKFIYYSASKLFFSLFSCVSKIKSLRSTFR
ncbi:B3 domain-containing protein REM17-like [Raphanus sativus]|uniref:B3 domain-containing protein REM17-like n=1 Tax=Raphanus sativus TaxID=3726 RepID=A0A9W3C2D5_RAPSA|nr:B3 domain-containing protein REM17-like [Raphanus sativus]